MMTDLFSGFDCGLTTLFPYAVHLCVFTIIVLLLYSASWTRQALDLKGKLMKSLVPSSAGTPSSERFFFFSLFMLLLGFNLTGLIPFTYSLTSNAWVVLSMSLLGWTFTTLWSIRSHPMKWMASFLPSGTPPLLVPLLVMVELFSLMIQPITLSLRLLANISMGHILLGMVGSILVSASVSATIFSSALMILLFNFELFVAGVQAYVFMTLMGMYLHQK